ncbi:MAG: hypothetical protein ACK559_37460, partial [bacterium]
IYCEKKTLNPSVHEKRGRNIRKCLKITDGKNLLNHSGISIIRKKSYIRCIECQELYQDLFGQIIKRRIVHYLSTIISKHGWTTENYI